MRAKQLRELAADQFSRLTSATTILDGIVSIQTELIETRYDPMRGAEREARLWRLFQYIQLGKEFVKDQRCRAPGEYNAIHAKPRRRRKS